MNKQDIQELIQRDILACIDDYLDKCFWREVLGIDEFVNLLVLKLDIVDHKHVDDMKEEISQIIVRRLNELN